MRRDTVYNLRTITLLHSLEVIAFVILEFCTEHNIYNIKDINLQPLSNNHTLVWGWGACFVYIDSLDF